MSPEEKKALVRQWIHKVWDAGDFSAFEQFAAPGYTYAAPGTGPLGRKALEAAVRDLKRHYSDHHNTFQGQVVDGDVVVTRGTTHLTDTATAAAIEIPWMVWTRLAGDKIAEDWEVYDKPASLQQIGAPPSQLQHPPGGYVTVNGVRLWYESEGNGEPLLLIAGGPGVPHDLFHPYFSALASSHRVIYFDAFGRGKSDRAKSPAEYTFNCDVDEVEELRKALGLGKSLVLGHSYGGMVAQAYALKYPDSISKLILVDTLYSAEMWQAGNDYMNYEVQNQFPEVWAKIQALRSKGLQGSAKEHQDAYAIPHGLMYFHDASIAERLGESFFSMNSDVYYAIAGDDADFLVGGDIARLDFRARLRKIHCPVLIIAGRYDRIVPPRYAMQYKEYAPQAQFVVMDHSGHFPFIEETAHFLQVMSSFIDAAPADPAPSVEAVIRKADAAWAEAIASKSLDRTLAVYAPEAVTEGSAMFRASGLAEFRAGWTRLFAEPGFALTWKTERVVVTEPGLAHSSGTWQNGKQHGPYLAVWQKQTDGQWKVLVDSAWIVP